MYNVLFICTANICRTPIAYGILQSLITAEGLGDRIQVDSAGTMAISGLPPTSTSTEICLHNGISVDHLRSKPISLNLLKESDLVLCMSTKHQDDLVAIFPHLTGKIFTLKGYQQTEDLEIYSIHDPFGKPIEAFHEAFTIIENEIRRIWPTIKQDALATVER